MSTFNSPEIVGEMSYAQLRKLALRIQLGMYRYQVDTLLRRMKPSLPCRARTIYLGYEGARIEVPFDAAQGLAHPLNRVSGVPQVFILIP
jgi:hypothetical protein